MFHRLAIAALLLSSTAFAAPITYVGVLSGAAEAPPNNSAGTGNMILTIDIAVHTLRVQVTFSGLTGTVTASHIHCCTATPGTGTAGVATQTPTFTGFPSGVTSGSYDQTFDLTQASSWNAAFITANGGTPASAESVLAAGLAAGRAYLNIHSSTFGGGEIRAFSTPEPGTWLLTSGALLLFGLGRRSFRRAPKH